MSEDKDKLRAAEQILDRGHGKPLSATISLPASKQQQAMLAALSDDELMARINGVELPKLTQDEFEAAGDPLLE